MAKKKTRKKTGVIPKRTFSWMNSKLEVRKLKDYGKGVFAKKPIKKNELLSIFGGYIREIKEEESLPKDFNDNGVQIGENYVITVLKRSELEDSNFFNHSCDPNAGFCGQIFLVAMKNIGKDEQITFDYAMALSQTKKGKPYKMKCLCGKKNCRKIITDNDWKKPNLRKKYKGYFQIYLQNKI